MEIEIMSQTSYTARNNLQLDLIPAIVKGNLKKGMEAAGASSGDLWTIDPFEIIVDERFARKTRRTGTKSRAFSGR
jgi:hypothetical protein